MNSKLKDFSNRNSLSDTILEDTTWDIFKDKSLLEKIKSILQWTANIILTEEQVREWYYYSREKWVTKLDDEQVKMNALRYLENKESDDLYNSAFLNVELSQDNRFSMISDKNEVINRNKNEFISWIKNLWILWISLTKEKLFLNYVNKWYISIDEVKNAILDYFKKVYIKGNSPLKGYFPWKKSLDIREYRCIVNDLRDDEKYILAYWMKKWLLSEIELNRIIEILKMGWYDLDYFYNEYYKENLFEIYLDKILSNKNL